MNKDEEKRLVVIGLDGATFELIRPMVERGRLPCIAELLSRGWSAPLLSTVPPITPPAWSSFATGAPPEEHGVFGFNYPDPNDYSLRLTTVADLRRPTLWRQLSRAGVCVLLLDVPFTFPPEPVNGCAVAGFPISSVAGFTSPPDLANRLESAGIACPPHPAEPPDPAAPGFLEWLDQFLNQRLQLFRHLAEQQPWQFAMVGAMALDWAQHALWKYFDPRFAFAGEPEAAERRETLFAAYGRVDRFVGDVTEAAGEQTEILLVSDHGFGTAFHYDWVSEALAQAGLLFWRSRGRGFAGTVGAAALKAVRSSARLQRLGKRWLGDTKAARTWARRARAYSQIDWDRTRVFPAGDYQLNLFINRRSCFSRGTVEDGDDSAQVLNDAMAALEGFRPPGHDLPLVRRIVRHECGGKEAACRTPDLSLELTVLPPASEAPVQPSAGLCGFHGPEGILISASGKWLAPDQSAKREIKDLAPAILSYFGIQSGGEECGGPATSAPAVSPEQTTAVLDSLRHLGYLD